MPRIALEPLKVSVKSPPAQDIINSILNVDPISSDECENALNNERLFSKSNPLVHDRSISSFLVDATLTASNEESDSVYVVALNIEAPENNKKDVDFNREMTVPYPYESLLDEVQQNQIELPNNLFTACIILPFSDKEYRTVIDLQMFGLLVANILVQGGLALYTNLIYRKNLEDLGKCGGYKTNFMLRMLCIIVYTGYCIADMLETLEMYSWLRIICGSPLGSKFDNMYVQFANFINRKICRNSGEEIDVDEQFEMEVVNGEDEENEITDQLAEQMANMSPYRKFFYFFGILGFKFGLSAWLLACGTGFVVTTVEDSDLILNALALDFILEIDNMVYDYFLTHEYKQVITNYMPRIQVKYKSEKTQKRVRYGAIVAKVVFLIIITQITYSSYC